MRGLFCLRLLVESPLQAIPSELSSNKPRRAKKRKHDDSEESSRKGDAYGLEKGESLIVSLTLSH